MNSCEKQTECLEALGDYISKFRFLFYLGTLVIYMKCRLWLIITWVIIFVSRKTQGPEDLIYRNHSTIKEPLSYRKVCLELGKPPVLQVLSKKCQRCWEWDDCLGMQATTAQEVVLDFEHQSSWEGMLKHGHRLHTQSIWFNRPGEPQNVHP